MAEAAYPDLTCDQCGRVFKGGEGVRSNFLRHMRTHDGQRQFACSECPATFTTKQNMARHMAAKHPDTPLPRVATRSRSETPAMSPVVGGKPEFPPEPVGDRPVAVHLRRHDVKCEECGKQFRYVTSLQYHMRQHHPDVAHRRAVERLQQQHPPKEARDGRGLETECPHCFALLSSPAKLTRHMQKHCVMRKDMETRKRNRETGLHFAGPDAGETSEASVSPLPLTRVAVTTQADGSVAAVAVAPVAEETYECHVVGCTAAFTTARNLRNHLVDEHGEV